MTLKNTSLPCRQASDNDRYFLLFTASSLTSKIEGNFGQKLNFAEFLLPNFFSVIKIVKDTAPIIVKIVLLHI
jgi:hypothetical protein